MFNFKLSLQALGSRSGASGGFVPSIIYQQGLFPLMLTDWPPVVPLPTSSSSLSFFDFSNQLFSLSSSLSLSSFSSFVSRHFLLYFLSISCSLIYLFAFFFLFPHISTCLNSFTTEVTATRSVIHLKARAHLYIPEVLPQKANHFSAGAEKSPDTPTQVGGGSGWWLSVVGVWVGESFV